MALVGRDLKDPFHGLLAAYQLRLPRAPSNQAVGICGCLITHITAHHSFSG